MKRLLLLIAIAISTNLSYAQLSGTYTIGGATPDYATITAAVADLNTLGVSGDVVFDIRTGSYTEQVVINTISGISGHRVTFQSETGNAADVIWRFASTSTLNYIVHLDEASNLTFQNLTFDPLGTFYQRVIYLEGDCDSVSILNNSFLGVPIATGSTTNAAIDSRFGVSGPDDFIVDNNTFNGFGFLCYMFDFSASGPKGSKRIYFTNNTATTIGDNGVRFYNQDSVFVLNNDLRFRGNADGIGVDVNICDYFEINNNRILNYGSPGGITSIPAGIKLYYVNGSSANRSQVVNNMVAGDHQGLEIDGATYVDIAFNNFAVLSCINSSGLALSVDNGIILNDQIRMANNIFSNHSYGRAFDVDGGVSGNGGLVFSDYNSYYAGDCQDLGYWDGPGNVNDLAALQAGTSMDANSMEVLPVWFADDSLYTWKSEFDNAGFYISDYTTDIDGNVRNNPPCIGASEYTSTYPVSVLSGTINVPADYPDLAAVAAAIDTHGTSGIVEVVMQPGTYTGLVRFNGSAGNSIADSLIIRSSTGNAADVVITAVLTTYTSVIEVRGISSITFKDVSIIAGAGSAGGSTNSCIDFGNMTTRINIIDCVMDGSTGYVNGISGVLLQFRMLGSSLNVGRSAVNSTISTPSCGSARRYAIIRNNQMIGIGGTTDGVLLNGLDYIEVSNNFLEGDGSATNNDGLYLRFCDTAIIANNVINNFGQYAIDYQYASGSSSMRRISNNSIYSPISFSRGIQTYQSSNFDIVHNSINVQGFGVRMYGTGSTGNTLANNIIRNEGIWSGSWYPYVINPDAIPDSSDYNLIYSVLNSNLVQYNGASYTDLASYQLASGLDANSISVDPGFNFDSLLYLYDTSAAIGAAYYSAAFPTDLIGESRPNPPAIGALEYSCIGMAGTYTIGGASPDYATFGDAVAAMLVCGIDGNVTFNIRPGTYLGQFEIPYIPGTDMYSVLFRAETGMATDVTLQHNPTSALGNYIVKLDSTSNIRFEDMSLSTTGSTYLTIFRIESQCKDIMISDCILSTAATPAAVNLNHSIVYCYYDQNAPDNIQLSGNTIVKGGYIFYAKDYNSANGDSRISGVSIAQNTSTTLGANGIYIEHGDNISITQNDFTWAATDNGSGIYMIDIDNFQIERNRLDGWISYGTTTSDYGIYLYDCDGTVGTPALISNNMVQGAQTCLYMANCAYIDIVYNSLSVDVDYSSFPLYVYTGNSNLRLYNNIISNDNYSNPGLAFYIAFSSAFSAMDYNIYHSLDCNLGIVGLYVADLAELQAAIPGENLNSIEARPFWDGAGDLHQWNPSLHTTGFHFIPTGSSAPYIDFDGESRPNPPTIGADEFTPDYTRVPVSGTITIPTEYPDLATLFAEVDSHGVSGTLVIELMPGTYTTQMAIPRVEGLGANDSIVLTSTTGNAADVILSPVTTSSLQAILTVEADRVAIHDITVQSVSTYGKGIWCKEGVKGFSLRNAVVDMGSLYTTYSSNIAVSVDAMDVLIRNVSITDGYYGVALGSSCSTVEGLAVIENIQVTDSYISFSTIFHPNVRLRDSYFANAGSKGFDFRVGVGDTLIFESNRIENVTTGMYCNLSDPSGGLCLLRNNVVESNVDGVLIVNSSDVQLINNTIVVSGAANAYKKAYSGDGNTIHNNIFVVEGMYPVIEVDAGTDVLSADNNLFYTPNNILATWNGSHSTLASLQAATGFDANSLVGNPRFNIEPTALLSSSPAIAAGASSALVASDYFGDGRPATPAIGAIEYSCNPLGGTYTIGGPTQDFDDFTQARDELYLCGIDAPTVFEAETGVYNEWLSFSAIPGATAINDVTFRSASGVNTDVELHNNTDVTGSNYVIQMDGSEHINFENMTFSRPDSNYWYSTIFHLNNSAGNVSVDNCRLLGSYVIFNTDTRALFYLRYGHSDSISLTNNYFRGGSLGIYHASTYAGLAEGYYIADNEFEYGLKGMLLDSVNNSVITGNYLHNEYPGSNSFGIRTFRSQGNEISYNTIEITNAVSNYDAIYYGFSGGTPSQRTQVFNNVITNPGPSFPTGNAIEVFGPNVDIAHNSINKVNGAGIFCTSGSGNTMEANMIAVSAGEMLHISPLPFSTINNNGYDFNGSNGNWYGSLRTDINSWKAAIGTDANSVDVDPLYVSTTDLNPAAVPVDQNAGSSYVATFDMNGVARGSNPDIGAYEFTPVIYNNAYDACMSVDHIGKNDNNGWSHLYIDREVVAAVKANGSSLGIITAETYLNSGAVRSDQKSVPYLDRNWHFDISGSIADSVEVMLYYPNAEYTSLNLADPSVSSLSDLGVTKYNGPNENCDYSDNDVVNTYRYFNPVTTSVVFNLSGYATQFWTNSFSEMYINGGGVALPVELIAWDAEREDEKTVELSWTTAIEIDNQGFEVWRQLDTEQEYSYVGWVDGAGNSTEVLNYSYDDENSHSGISYYKLKQVDFNGNYEWTDVRAVSGMKGQTVVTVYPNPTQDYLVVNVSGGSAAHVEAVNALGQIVLNAEVSGVTVLDKLEWASGIYHVNVTLPSGESSVHRIMVE